MSTSIGKLTVFFEEPFWVVFLNELKMVSFQFPK